MTPLDPTAQLVGLLLVFLILPVAGFLISGRISRRNEITGPLTPKAIEDYFKRFHPNRPLPAKDKHEAEFLKLYEQHLGLMTFIFPGVVLLAAIGIGIQWVRIGAPLYPTTLGAPAAGTLAPMAVAAALGAYMWALIDFTEKYLRRSLAPANLWWASFRFVIAVPMAYALTGYFKEDVGVPTAFLLGVFPTQWLIGFARKVARKRMNFGEGPQGQESELQTLQSMDPRMAERLADENILTNLQLAYADPIVLSIRTNLGFSTVVDFVSQALLWIYLEDDAKTLRKFGLRGAQEVRSLWDELHENGDGTPEEKAEYKASAERTLATAAAELKMDKDALQYTFGQVALDPYTTFLCKIWQ
ncbi:MAG: hypothetical protein O2968_01060 [Acidobacteria bacterium]|nr:hypothetical protein [Acidobacteriota bacterium]